MMKDTPRRIVCHYLFNRQSIHEETAAEFGVVQRAEKIHRKVLYS
jgi:hypothetical protein